MPILLQLALILVFFVVVSVVSRRWDAPEKPPGILHDYWQNIYRSFFGFKGVAVVLAIAVTVAMVLTPVDRQLQDLIQSWDPLGKTLPLVFLIGGNVWHLVAGFAIYLAGRARKNQSLQVAGCASLQATLSQFFVVTFLKAFSGRRGPLDLHGEHHAPFPKTTDATDFRFDFWNHTFSDGRFFWPSGHTAATIAFVSALAAYYPEKRWIRWVGYPFVALTAWAMVDGDFHWFSDIIAGAIIGHVIGWTIGRHFRRELRSRTLVEVR